MMTIRGGIWAIVLLSLAALVISSNYSISNGAVNLSMTPDDGNLTPNASISFSCTANASTDMTNISLMGDWKGWHLNETALVGGISNQSNFLYTINSPFFV